MGIKKLSILAVLAGNSLAFMASSWIEIKQKNCLLKQTIEQLDGLLWTIQVPFIEKKNIKKQKMGCEKTPTPLVYLA
jgi:hypothetical protein